MYLEIFIIEVNLEIFFLKCVDVFFYVNNSSLIWEKSREVVIFFKYIIFVVLKEIYLFFKFCGILISL